MCKYHSALLCEGYYFFSNCACGRALRKDLNLIIAHDEIGVLFNGIVVGCVVKLALLAVSVELSADSFPRKF